MIKIYVSIYYSFYHAIFAFYFWYLIILFIYQASKPNGNKNYSVIYFYLLNNLIFKFIILVKISY